jgi:hypothetical protein
MNKSEFFVQKIMDKTHVLRFIPENLGFLREHRSIESGNKNLKTDYLFDLIHTFVINYHFNGHDTLNLCADIVKEKYGGYYKAYISYLEQVGFIDMISNYRVGYKAKTYALTSDVSKGHCIRVKCTDNVYMKKWRDYKLSHMDEPSGYQKELDPVRKSLIEDLYFIKLDFEKAARLLNNYYDIGCLRLSQYRKNQYSIESIADESFFWSFDKFGRMHTNFTVLKKNIRSNCLTIHGEQIEELDIPNAQPLFLAIILKESGFSDSDELDRFVNAVRKGEFYEDFMNEADITRNDAKKLIFKVFFGKSIHCWHNNIFKKIYPKIYRWISEYKYKINDYRALSWELQKIESTLMFDNIVKDIKKEDPKTVLFTVHDSVYFQKSNLAMIQPIFTNHVENLWHSQFKQELYL